MSTTTATADTTAPIPNDFNPDIKITNNSGVDVMVLDGYASSATAQETLYEQTLKILADTNNATTLKNGSSTTYELHDSYYDDDYKEWAYSFGYNLIIVRADNLFPVKVVGVGPNDDESGYDDITITQGDTNTKGDFQTMKDSQAFQQNLMAYPDSVMATQFASACGDSMDNANSSTDIDSKVDAFFSSTDSYKNVTLNSLTAIQTYWGSYPFIWAGYNATKSYYLYSSDGSATSYVGSLDITAPVTAPASTDKNLSGFSFAFNPANASAQNPKKTLKYVNGQFLDSTETTTVALKGLYQLKSQFTNVATDNVIKAYMTGSVNGAKVIGYDEKLQQDSEGNWSGFYQMLHPKDAAGWMTLILEVGAVAMTLELFSRPLKYLWDKFKESKSKNKGEEPSKEDADKMREDAKGKQTNDSVEAQRTMDRMGPDITIKIEINVNINTPATQLQTDRADRMTEDSRSNLTDVTGRQEASMNTLKKYGMDNDIEKMGSKIHENKIALDPVKTPTEKLSGMLDTVKSTAKGLVDSISQKVTKLVDKIKGDDKKALDEAKKTNEDALETQEEIEKNKDTADKGDDDAIELDDIPKGEK